MLKAFKISPKSTPRFVLLLSSTILAFLYISYRTAPFLEPPLLSDPNLADEGTGHPNFSLDHSKTEALPPAPDAAAGFVLHTAEFLSLPAGKERLEQLVPFLVKLSAPNPIYVVQVGANTGYELKFKRHSKDDPTVAAVKNEAARGVLVEPVPANFAKLTANVQPYAERFKCINAAVNTGNGAPSKMPFYTMNARRVRKEWRTAPNWFQNQLGSFDVHHLKKHFAKIRRTWIPKQEQDYYIISTIVDALPPQAIIEQLYEKFPDANKETGGDGISLLHVDAEGFDWKIMHAFLKTTRPRAIVFEHLHLQISELRSATAFLKSIGYVHWDYGQNTYAVYLGGFV